MTTSLIESGELKLAAVLLHQDLEAFHRDYFTERNVDGIRAGLCHEDLDSLVGEVEIKTD